MSNYPGIDYSGPGATKRLVEWISAQSGISNVQPISIRIEGEQWEGVKYTFTGKWEAGQDGVTRGEHEVGEEWQEERFYFLGELPKSYRPKGRKNTIQGVCYTGPNGETFYVSCYMGGHEISKCPPEIVERYHQLGPSFMLHIWPEKFGPIDKYEEKPYKRIPMSMSTTEPSVD